MNPLEQARLAWQSAQAELQGAQAELERRVANLAKPGDITEAHDVVRKRQQAADLLLHRYITQVGKS